MLVPVDMSGHALERRTCRSALVGGGVASGSRVHILCRQSHLEDGRLPGAILGMASPGAAGLADEDVAGAQPAGYAFEDPAGDPGHIYEQQRELLMAHHLGYQIVSAVTVAVSGPPSRRAISPMNSPGPRVSTVCPSMATVALPCRITMNSRPSRPPAGDHPAGGDGHSGAQAREATEVSHGAAGEEQHGGQHPVNICLGHEVPHL